MDVFPIPPAPMRAIGIRLSTRSTISPMSFSRPKKALGGGGGDSPGMLDTEIRRRSPWESNFTYADPFRGCAMVIICSVIPGNASFTHHLILTVDIHTDFGDALLYVLDITLNLENNGAGFHIAKDVGGGPGDGSGQ